jgi:hypothetical protein
MTPCIITSRSRFFVVSNPRAIRTTPYATKTTAFVRAGETYLVLPAILPTRWLPSAA